MRHTNRRLGELGVCAVAILLVVGFIGCTGDDGEDGADGAMGDQGPMGPPGTATCMECHADNWDLDVALDPIRTEFAISQHNTGDTFVRRGSVARPQCSRCHTNEGYQAYLETGTEQAVSQSSRIACFTCHAPHTTEDFSLRNTGATDLTRFGTYDKGTSNACAICHQVRAPSPDFASADPIRSPYWGPHHGPQANMLAGVGAYEFDGTAYDSDASHAGIGAGCVHCHMSEVADDALGGGHSFWMRYESYSGGVVNAKGCACHTEWPDDQEERDEAATADVDAVIAAFDAELAAMKQTLMDRGWIDDENHIDTATPPTTADDRGAVYNYLMLLEDRSGGIHNPVYANAVMEATKNYLTP